MLQIIIVDDHILIRHGIANQLQPHNNIKIIAQGACGAEVYPLVEQHRPDVLILDVNMPQQTGSSERFKVIPAVARLRQDFPNTAIIILSQHVEISIIRHAIERGVQGYLAKSDDFTDEIANAILSAAQGGTVFSPSVQEVLTQNAMRENVGSPLSRRETEILLAIASQPQCNFSEIASQLNIARTTFKTHTQRIYEKLGAENALGAVLKAMYFGIIPFEIVGETPQFILPWEDNVLPQED